MKHYTEVLTKEEIEELEKYDPNIERLFDDFREDLETATAYYTLDSLRDNGNIIDSSIRFERIADAAARAGLYGDPSIARMIGKYMRELSESRCPENGAFYGYKKAMLTLNGDRVIVELHIPEDAKRANPYFSDICRCDKAIVTGIYSLNLGDDGNPVRVDKRAVSLYTRMMGTSPLYYSVGEMVTPDWFDEDPWTECSHGINFYVGRIYDYFNRRSLL